MNASVDGGWTVDSDTTTDAPPGSTFSADQYTQAALALLPPGRAWSREEGSNQVSFWEATGEMYEEQDGDSLEMLSNFFPATATEGIDEWNSALGIPDICGGAPADQAANQQQIVAKFVATGGQSVAYFTALAAALGYEISITEFDSTHVGGDAPAGMIVNINDWDYTWRVNILNAAEAPADTTMLQCLLTRYKPAHTQFYIVDGEPLPFERLFNVTDTVEKSLELEVT